MNNAIKLAILGLVFVPSFAFAASVNINTADSALLDTLPGIGPSKAAAIIQYRTAHGPFSRIEDIQEVKGIGPSTFAQMQSMITVSGGESTVVVQPKAPTASSINKQTVEPAVAVSNNDGAHAEEVVVAPGAAMIAASGAIAPEGVIGSIGSWWTLAFLGLLLIAGAALLIL